MIPPALLCALSLAAPPRAAADIYDTFSVTGTFVEPAGTTFEPGSTITIDITDGLVTASNLIVNGGGLVIPPGPAVVTGVPAFNSATLYDWVFPAAECFLGQPCQLLLGDTSPTGFAGFTGGLVTLNLFCTHCVVTLEGLPAVDTTVNGLDLALVSSVTTPEPGSFTLPVGIFIVGMALWRRRIAAIASAPGKRRT